MILIKFKNRLPYRKNMNESQFKSMAKKLYREKHYPALLYILKNKKEISFSNLRILFMKESGTLGYAYRSWLYFLEANDFITIKKQGKEMTISPNEQKIDETIKTQKKSWAMWFNENQQ